MTHEFIVGDRVAYTHQGERTTATDTVPYGVIGTVVHIPSRGSIGVQFDQDIEGHNCDGHAKHKYGWYCKPEHLLYLYENVNTVQLRSDRAEREAEELDDLFDSLKDVDSVRDIAESTKGLYDELVKGGGIGINLSGLTARSKRKYMDAVREDQGMNNKSEVKQVKLAELTQGLPLLGLRVMINPESQAEYREKYRNKSGNIVRLNGTSRDAYKQIHQYKKNGKASGWNCRVRFDNGIGELDVLIEDMLPVQTEQESIIHEIHFTNGERFYWTNQNYENQIDKYVISYQWNVGKHIAWNDAERQKVLDEH